MPEKRSEPNGQLCATSSTPPVFTPEQHRLYGDVLDAFLRERLPFAVAGAFAFQCYTGIWRWTKDLDIFLPREYIPRALALCAQLGFETEVRDPVWLAKAWHEDYFVDLISGMSNGVVWVTDDWIRRAQPAQVLGLDVPILGANEMILSKMFVTHRDRFDGADIAHIIYRSGDKLDWDYLISAAGDNWELLLWHLMLYHFVYPIALDRVPRHIWQVLTERFRDAVLNPDLSRARFRGSIVDDVMFQIDFAEWGMENLHEVARRERLSANESKREAFTQ
jgi:hypothetical protein